MKWNYFSAAFLLLFAVASAEGEIWEEDDHEILIRSERGAKNRDDCTKCDSYIASGIVVSLIIEPCRYDKGPWTECEPKTNIRSRTLSLKKGDSALCEATKTIQKKCKKACRYEKGTWSECNGQSKVVRVDQLKANSDPSCEQKRQITKNCKGKIGKGKSGKGGENYGHDNKKKNGGGNRRNKQ